MYTSPPRRSAPGWLALVLTGCSFHPAAPGGDGGSGAVDATRADDGGEIRPDAAPPPPPCQLALGSDHTCLRTSGGELWCVGADSWGELGDGGSTNAANPMPVRVLVSGVAEVATRFFHTCVRHDDATVSCWGQNDRGQLGDGSKSNAKSPVQVSGLTGVVELGLGRTYSCARRASDVTCWGGNDVGQLGDGPMGALESLRPVTSVVGLLDPVALAPGASHACARLGDGGAACWGSNLYFQLGVASPASVRTPLPTPVAAPTQVVAAGYNLGAVAVGGHTCALRADGTAACWGSHEQGQLGDGVTSVQASVTPVAVAGLTDLVELVAGRFHVCARARLGDVWCWGNNEQGQVEVGGAALVPTPTKIGLPGAALALAAGGFHTCAILVDHSIQCWGGNGAGQLGTGQAGLPSAPVAATLACR